jgi:hypothetical protein
MKEAKPKTILLVESLRVLDIAFIDTISQIDTIRRKDFFSSLEAMIIVIAGVFTTRRFLKDLIRLQSSELG